MLEVHKQPGGVKEVDAQYEDAIYAGGKYWAINDKAEIIGNLNLRGTTSKCLEEKT